MIGDQRAPGAPPCDSLAEAVVLSHLLVHPEKIADLDLGPLLVFPEHRTCWQVMVRVWMRQGGADSRAFMRAWLEELERVAPGKSLLYWDTMQPREQTMRTWEEADAHLDSGEDCAPLSDHSHGFEWWLMRLRRVAEARMLISAAQQMAERAWAEDVEEALAIACEACAPATAVPTARVSLIDGLDV